MNADDLAAAVGLGNMPDEELIGILSGVLPLSRWESGRRVSYFHPQEGHALDIVYGRDGKIIALEPATGLTTELLDDLRELASSVFDEPASYEVCRDPLFSVPRVQGYWRHRDEWQVLPAPPHAPDPDFELAEHPFVLEYRIKSSSNHVVGLTRRRRRLWELHILLALLLRGRITREPSESQHH